MSESSNAVTPVAVVTGSSSGIGRATAIALRQAGYAVVVHARSNLIGLQSVVEELHAQDSAGSIPRSGERSYRRQTVAGERRIPHSGERSYRRQTVAGERRIPRSGERSYRRAGNDQVLCVTGDIACPNACRDMVAAAFGWRGRVDAWVNNAGADVLTGSARQQSFAVRLQRLCEVDVQGTVRLSRLVAPRMLDQPPRSDLSPALPCIVNIGWDQAQFGMEGEPGQLFGTTKAAVAAFTMSLGLSYPGIRVNCVAPGWIQTQWGQSSASGYWAQRAVDESLQQRWGTPDDVAATIAWLVSDASNFVNGQIVAVNGGRRFYPQ